MNRNQKIFVVLWLVAFSSLATALYYETNQKPAYIDLHHRERYLPLRMEYHITVYFQRVNDPYPILWDHNAGVATTIGLDWLEDQIGDSPSTDPAKWISLSDSASAPSAAWTQIPSEIAANGLTRAAATYASTGSGQWTQTYQFTFTGTQSCRLMGLNYGASGDNNLLFADTFTQVSGVSGDKLTMVATVSIA